MGGNIAEEAQGIRLVAALLVLAGERERSCGKAMRLLQIGRHSSWASPKA